jgi:hypothetical protein
MPIDVTLSTDLGVNSVRGSTGEVGPVATGDYALIRIDKQSILRSALSVGAPGPITYDLEIIPGEALGVPYHCSNFAFLAPGGVPIAITFRLYNDGTGNGSYQVKARRTPSTDR